MLSYMREDNNNGTTSANDRQKRETDRAPCHPADAEQDYLVPENTGKRANRNTMVLLVLFFAGLLLLGFMVKRVDPLSAEAAMTDDSMQIERAVANLTGVQVEMDGKLNDAVRKISTLSDIKQVAVDELSKNPFSHSLVRQITGIRTGGKVNKSTGQTAVEKADELHLWTIVSSGKKRSCMINDKILYEGDNIMGLRVNHIAEDFVELVGQRTRVVLRMSK